MILRVKPKRSFINKNCELCGKPELVLSAVQLTCNYGSKNDGERLTLHICGACTDKLYSFILKESEENKHKEQEKCKAVR